MKRFFPVAKVRQSYSKHPVLTILFAVLIVMAIVITIAIIVKMKRKEEDLLDEEWDLDDEDGDEVYFYPGDEDVVNGFIEE